MIQNGVVLWRNNHRLVLWLLWKIKQSVRNGSHLRKLKGILIWWFYGVHDRGDMEYEIIYFWWSWCVDRDQNKTKCLTGFNVTDWKCLLLMTQILF
jgi:hypothetical protein